MDIDLTPILNWLLTVAGLIFALARAYASLQLKKRVGIEMDLVKNQNLQQAIDNAIRYARNLAVGEDGKLTIHTSNLMVGWAADYIVKRFGETMDHFNLSPDDIREMIVAKMPELGTYMAESPAALKPATAKPTQASLFPMDDMD